jgi:hypothetical protein
MIKKYHLDINFEPDYELTLNEWGQWSADFDRHATDPIITNKIENLLSVEIVGSTYAVYMPGMKLDLHSDYSEYGTPIDGTCVVFLNTCSGGELVFPYKNKEFKPIKGDVIVFPATTEYSHKTNNVKSMKRVLICPWVYKNKVL